MLIILIPGKEVTLMTLCVVPKASSMSSPISLKLWGPLLKCSLVPTGCQHPALVHELPGHVGDQLRSDGSKGLCLWRLSNPTPFETGVGLPGQLMG